MDRAFSPRRVLASNLGLRSCLASAQAEIEPDLRPSIAAFGRRSRARGFHSQKIVRPGNVALPMKCSLCVAALLSLCSAGCVHFISKPIDAERTAARLSNRTLTAKTWTLKALVDEAVRNHPDVGLARAQYGTAKAAIRTAGESPNP